MKRYHDYIKKTTINNEHREQCVKNAEYYKIWNTQTTKYSEWSGPQYYKIRANSERTLRENEQRQSNLKHRRQLLAEKLRREAILHSIELHNLKQNEKSSMNDLRFRHHELREKLDADARSEAELQLYHQWRRDEPSVRLAESEFRRGFAKQAWAEQVEAKLAVDAAAKREADKLQKQQNLAALQELQAVQLTEQRRREEECRVAQLNAKEAQDRIRVNFQVSEDLKREEIAAARLEQELFQLEQERARLEKQRQKTVFKAGLQRQATFRLRQRALEIQRELEEDQALLRRVHQAIENEKSLEAERLQACRELAVTLKNMTEQAHREAALAKLNANIFHEEALIELNVQEERWKKEQTARRSLLTSVLAEQQAQARATRERAAKQRQKLEEEYKELQLVTNHHRELQRAQAELRVQQQRNYQEELDQQVAEKQTQKQQEEEKRKSEENERRKKAAAEAARLDEEMKKITLGKQRVAWL